MPTPRTILTKLFIASTALGNIAHATEDTTSIAVDTRIKLSTDIRSRGTSDSLLQPGVRFNANVAHESGWVGFMDLATASKKQFLGSNGLSAVVGTGWRTGDPDGWHFGLGAATEFFPGARFEAPHSIDLESFTPTNVKKTNYNSSFAVLEAGYGALEFRAMNQLSKTYRGLNTGGVCGTLMVFNPDPMVGINCFGRGDKNSRGSWLFDMDYKIPLSPQTSLNLHAGIQRIKNFREANMEDYAIALTHKRWGFEFTAEWLVTRTQARELYLYQDGNRLRAVDNNKLVLTVAHKF